MGRWFFKVDIMHYAFKEHTTSCSDKKNMHLCVLPHDMVNQVNNFEFEFECVF